MTRQPSHTDMHRALSAVKSDAIGSTAGRLAILKAVMNGETDADKLRAASRAAKA